jgi:hypothetical protein
MSPAPPVYGFGTGRSPGVALGLSAAQAVCCAAALAVTVSLLAAHASLPAAVAAGLALALPAVTPVRGRPAIGWVTPAVEQMLARPATTPLEKLGGSEALTWPRCLPRSTLSEIDTSVGRAGVARHRADAICAVAVTPPPRFASRDQTDQGHDLARVGRLLDTLAGATGIRAVRWVERADPVAPFTEPGPSGSVRDSCHLVLEFTGQGETAAGSLATVVAGLAGSGARGDVLDVDGLAELLARCLHGGPAIDAAVASIKPAWDHVRVDDTVHRFYAVTRWPPGAVGPGWLHPLLAAPLHGASRTLSTRLVTVPPPVAARRARAARATADLDHADRRRLGLTDSHLDQLASDAATDLAADLTLGHSAHAVSTLVGLAATDTATLDRAGRELTAAVTGLRLALRPLHGQHLLALRALLPGGAA